MVPSGVGQPGEEGGLLGDVAGPDLLLDGPGTEVVHLAPLQPGPLQQGGEGLGEELVGHHVLEPSQGGQEGCPDSLHEHDPLTGGHAPGLEVTNTPPAQPPPCGTQRLSHPSPSSGANVVEVIEYNSQQIINFVEIVNLKINPILYTSHNTRFYRNLSEQ